MISLCLLIVEIGDGHLPVRNYGRRDTKNMSSIWFLVIRVTNRDYTKWIWKLHRVEGGAKEHSKSIKFRICI